MPPTKQAAKAAQDDEPVSVDEAARAEQVQQDYRNDVEERRARSTRNTIDALEPSVGWTSQAGTGWDDPNSPARGQQVFTPEQLPDPTVAMAAGLKPQVRPSEVLEGDEAFGHPRGPEPGEQVRAEKRAAVAQRLIDDGDVTGDDLDMTAVDEEATSAHGKALQARARQRAERTGAEAQDDSRQVEEERGEPEEERE